MDRQFIWGSATAAYQCEGAWNEGGRGLTQWDVFSHESNRNINHVTGDVAADFYHQYETDIRMLAESGQNTFRFSIAWSRIFPENSDIPNEEGIEFYQRVLDTCQRYHVIPNVTLQHYDLPEWVVQCGGWANRSILEPFRRYARTCFQCFGKQVPLWVTNNEIRFYAHCAYLQGNYPPHHELDFQSYAQAVYFGVLGSAVAVEEYRKLGLPGKIGIVHACGATQTIGTSEADAEAYRNAELYYVSSVLDPAVKGYYGDELLNKAAGSGINLSFIQPEDKEILKNGTVDFLGLNIYCRNLVKPYEGGPSVVSFNNLGQKSLVKEGSVIKGWFATDEDPSVPKNAWGREVYPRCIYDCLKYISQLYPGIPLYVTENGVACYDRLEDGKIHDRERIEVMGHFLDWVVKAYDEGIDVRGYYMWSTTDVYSWVNGYQKRYGLVFIDFDNGCRRVPKDSLAWYQKYIEQFYLKRPFAAPMKGGNES